jgi:hypothetical protein
LNVETECS